MHVCRLN